MSNDGDLDRALQIFQEFGPNRAIPVQKRWQEAFPDVTVDQMLEWETLFRELERFAYGLGEQVWNGEIGDAEASAMIEKRFRMLSPDHVSRTLSQAIYFARN